MSYLSTDVTELVREYGMCFGSVDGIEISKAIEIFGFDAVDFAKKLHTPGKKDDGYFATYGICGYSVSFLTISGCRVAATYLNCLEIKQREQAVCRKEQAKSCVVVNLFPEKHTIPKRGRPTKAVPDVGYNAAEEKARGDLFKEVMY